MEFINNFFQDIDQNKIIIGFLTIFAAIGPKYIYDDLDYPLEKLLDSAFMRKFYIFVFVYLGTREWLISLLITIIYTIFIYFYVDENKKTKQVV